MQPVSVSLPVFTSLLASRSCMIASFKVFRFHHVKIHILNKSHIRELFYFDQYSLFGFQNFANLSSSLCAGSRTCNNLLGSMT